MKLIRLACVYLTPPLLGEWESRGIKWGDIDVAVGRRWEQERSTRLLVLAETPLAGLPIVNARNQVEIPAKARKDAERAIEHYANLIGVCEGVTRRITSPLPPVLFRPVSNSEETWLAKRDGIALSSRLIAEPTFGVGIQTASRYLGDRLDGASLLTEALASSHATGAFHELARFFERAFALSHGQLLNPLGRFLLPNRQGFSHAEVRRWVELRGPATHGDRRAEMAIEADVRPLVPRMKQAAYDLLLNKLEWHSPSVSRRDVWEAIGGTTSPNHDQFCTQGLPYTMTQTLMDGFLAYNYDFSAALTSTPEGCWPPIGDGQPRTPVEPATGKFDVRRGRCVARTRRDTRCANRVADPTTQLCALHRGVHAREGQVEDFETGEPVRAVDPDGS